MLRALIVGLFAAGCGSSSPKCAAGMSFDADPLNCGACGHKCAAPMGVTATCTAGTCGLSCPAGTADCDGNTANGCETMTTSDAANCGACSHACGGTVSCLSGFCAPELMQHQAQTLYGITVDDNNLYWVAYQHPDGSVLSAPKTPNAPVTTLTSFEDGPVDVFVDGNTLFFTDYDGGAVSSVPIDAGGMPTMLFQKANHFPQRVRVVGGLVYWTAWDGTVNRMNKDGSGQITIAAGQSEPVGFQVESGTIYWVNRMMAIVRSASDMAAAQPKNLAAGILGGGDLALDADGLYVTTNDDGRVLKVAKDGSGDPIVLASGGGTTTRILVDNGLLYYRAGSQIVRMTTKGESAVILANTTNAHNGGLALDASFVYYADDNSTIWRVAR